MPQRTEDEEMGGESESDRHQQCQDEPHPQHRNQPRWIDARRPLAEELEELRLEQETGRNGGDQHDAREEVEGAQDPEEDS